MAEAARMVEANGARLIDINMGCPAKKVTTGWSGSALMREPDHALRLIEAVVGAVTVPVGAVESLVRVRTVAVLVLPALSVEVMDSVGLWVAPAGQAKLLVVT